MKIGIIGCGSITKYRHAPEYDENPYVKEIVFYDRNPERAEALAELFNGSVAQTAEDLFEDESIVAISDCSSNDSHHIFSTKALLSGKHVLTEKPIALTVEDAKEILDAQKKTGKWLMVDHNQRFTKAHQKAKSIIKSGELGNVLTFKTNFGHGGPESWGVNKSNSTWFFKKDRSGYGVAADLGIHKLDLIHYLLNDRINQVSAFQGVLDKVDENGQPIEVCDNIICNLRTEGGKLGTASFSWTYYGEEDNSTTIYFEKGIMKIYQDDQYQIEVLTKDGEKINYEIEAIQTNDNQTNTGVIDAFVDSVRNETEPIVTGQDALESLKVVLAIIESADKNQVVMVK
ncbi:Gfo/Idh/MocA family protein [Aquisalibacillus elongatus]|uniref:Putative dehydrogenase n=1 Tax=Aquisalibacillus elongatus TaxID=485577 RepID=A0A3N5BU85_9BACI|nr:Gfo/Idh/MocA family oxidoreductase [Aquisalibacillus elongatus]RPF53338.1 putative dehydrogenase [Aquisalibacillus elongatus]